MSVGAGVVVDMSPEALRLRVKVRVPTGGSVPTLQRIWRSAGWPCHDLIEVEMVIVPDAGHDQDLMFPAMREFFEKAIAR